MSLYNGIPNKYCVCDGEEVNVEPCPEGLVCDSSRINCKGKIIGFRFGYSGEAGRHEFADLAEWENFCAKLIEGKDECLTNLNYTKSKIK